MTEFTCGKCGQPTDSPYGLLHGKDSGLIVCLSCYSCSFLYPQLQKYKSIDLFHLLIQLIKQHGLPMNVPISEGITSTEFIWKYQNMILTESKGGQNHQLLCLDRNFHLEENDGELMMVKGSIQQLRWLLETQKLNDQTL